MSNVCFVMLVFNGDYVLPEVLSAILPYGKVVVAEGPVKYFRERWQVTTSTDETNVILDDLVGDNVVRRIWDEKDDMMRALVPLIPTDTTHLWMVDSDEVWRAQDIEKVLCQLEDVDSVSFKPYSFFGGFERVLTGFEMQFEWIRIQRFYPGATWATHRPPTILAPDGRPWREHRHLSLDDVRFWHYSYVWASQVLAKAGYYQFRSDCIPDWFQTVWLRWVLGNDLTRQIIEDEYDGVHEWKPERRGPCRTELFTGEHPAIIQDALPRLKRRFEKELRNKGLQWL